MVVASERIVLLASPIFGTNSSITVHRTARTIRWLSGIGAVEWTRTLFRISAANRLPTWVLPPDEIATLVLESVPITANPPPSPDPMFDAPSARSSSFGSSSSAVLCCRPRRPHAQVFLGPHTEQGRYLAEDRHPHEPLDEPLEHWVGDEVGDPARLQQPEEEEDRVGDQCQRHRVQADARLGPHDRGVPQRRRDQDGGDGGVPDTTSCFNHDRWFDGNRLVIAGRNFTFFKSISRSARPSARAAWRGQSASLRSGSALGARAAVSTIATSVDAARSMHS